MSTDIIDQIKRMVPIGSLLGTDKKRIKCPLPGHNDKHPSCDVDHAAGIWHCKVCDVGGTVFDLLMQRDRKTFKEALEELARQCGISLERDSSKESESKWAQERKAEMALAYAANYYHEKVFAMYGAMQWLSRRGFDEKTIRHFRLGMADGSLVNHLTDSSIEGLSFSDFVNAGLIVKDKQENYRDYFFGRITFPLILHGKVMNISGRVLMEDEKPKYLHLKGRSTEYFYNQDALQDSVWLFEGHPDTVIAHQCNIPAIGVIGTSGMTHPERLKHCTEIFICGDSDTAGENASSKWAAEILKHNPACKVKFVVFPDSSKDFNEWYIKNSGAGFYDAFQALHQSALGIIEHKISKLKSTDDLTTVWPLLETLPDISRQGYFQAIKKQLPSLGVKVIREAFSAWVKLKKVNAPSYSVVGESYQKNCGKLPSNIGFEGFKSHVCLFADISRKAEEEDSEITSFEPVILQVTINPETGSHTSESIYLENQGDFNPQSVPLPYVVNGRWSPDGIQAFKNGAPLENTSLLLADLTAYFKRYIWHEDPMTYETLALYSMGTYVARLFQAYPYLSLNGLAGSGKTNTLELLEQVCFNAIMAANVSLAAMFRMVEKCFSTYIRDEAEQFNKRTPENQDELLVLNSGYKASGIVSRVEKGKNGEMDIAYFNVYSPKVFAGINMLNETLLTRSILITMFKAPSSEVVKLVSMAHRPDQWKGEAAKLRDRLYSWALTKFYLVAEAYRGFPAQEKISNRDWEVWSPLLAIALLADNEQVAPGDSATQRLLRFAELKSNERKANERDNAIEPKVLMTVLQLIEDQKVTQAGMHQDYYFMSVLAKAAHESLAEEGYFKKKELDARWLGKILRTTRAIGKDGCTKDVKDVNGKTKLAVHLTKQAIETALDNL